MKTPLLVCTLFLAFSQIPTFASETPAWGITDKEDMLKNYVDRQFLNPPVAQSPVAAPLAAQSQAASSSIGLAPDAITPEIEELARGLQYDALAIYNYCHNKIEYEHYWGSYKGATLTLLEGSGNCFDISSLMVALLRESGYTANYRYGVRRVSDWDLEQWHGLAIYGGSDLPFDELTDAQLVAEYGILPWFDANDPNNVYDWRFMLNRLNFSVGRGYPIIDTAFGYGVAWDLPHIWLEVDDGGTTYELDPSFKLKDPVESPIDLEAATQYSRTNLLSQAGGSTTSNSVTGLSETNIATEMTTYTSNLTQWLKANRHKSSVGSIMGRVRTIESFPATLAVAEITEGSSNDYLASKSWLTTSTIAAIPEEWMPTLSITLGLYNYSTEQFTTVGFTDDICLSALQGQKLSLWFNGNQTNLYLDETALSSVSLSGGTVDIGLSVDHPHGYFQSDGTFIDDGNNDTSSPVVTRYIEDDTNAYAFPYSFRAGARLIRNRQNALQGYLQDGVLESDWKVRTEMLNITGLSFMEQTELSDVLVGSVFGVEKVSFHRFGRVAQEDSYYVATGWPRIIQKQRH
ncbi:MAG: transglutaminase-like domain-containing protein [Lentimonas sp.]